LPTGFPSAGAARASAIADVVGSAGSPERRTGTGICEGGVRVDLEEALRLTNRGLIGFDLVLGTATLLAPDATLRALGHDEPSPDARHLFRRCGPIWLTFAAAHAVAERRDRPRDWWALAWLRGTELATDIVWARSESFSRPGARSAMRLAGAFNLGATLGFGWLARERSGRRSRFRTRRYW
jgi:hypothetical protein